MKTYEEVKMLAKNAPSGSYAAGCPTHTNLGGGSHGCYNPEKNSLCSCTDCMVAS